MGGGGGEGEGAGKCCNVNVNSSKQNKRRAEIQCIGSLDQPNVHYVVIVVVVVVAVAIFRRNMLSNVCCRCFDGRWAMFAFACIGCYVPWRRLRGGPLAGNHLSTYEDR